MPLQSQGAAHALDRDAENIYSHVATQNRVDIESNRKKPVTLV